LFFEKGRNALGIAVASILSGFVGKWIKKKKPASAGSFRSGGLKMA
jgi:hypothetical protein